LNGHPSEVEKYNYDRLLKKLNPQQRNAVFHQDGPCAVISVPGSGKTACLTLRFIRLIKNNIEPERIMCCTFTKKAAIEMKERIIYGLNRVDIPPLSYIGTMHSLFLRMLKEHPKYYKDVTVCSREFSRTKYIAKAAEKIGDPPESPKVNEILRWISYAKNNLMDPTQLKQYIAEHKIKVNINADNAVPVKGSIEHYYALYEDNKMQEGSIDYDDMIYQTWDMFKHYPGTLKRWQESFDYIMIDEFQDINRAQWEVIKMLIGTKKNLFIVGDGNQSIYGFRGSSPEFLFNIQRELGDSVRIINMNTNYRSGKKIIDVANVIMNNMTYKSAEIVGSNTDGLVNYNVYPTDMAEADIVCKKIVSLIEQGVNPEQIAVIYRMNACAAPYELGLAIDGVKFYSKSGDGFFGMSVVKDVIAYLRAAVLDDISCLSRIINIPNRYLGKAFIAEWKRAIDSGIDPKEALLMQYSFKYWEKGASDLYYHLDMISRESFNAEKAIKYICNNIKYRDWINNKCSDDNVVNKSYDDILLELQYIGTKYGSVMALLEVIGGAGKSFKKTKDDAVTLTTIHGSKGLEFDHIFFVALDQGIIPHNNSVDIDEERRMFYVGVTRARKQLFLSGSVKFVSRNIQKKESEFITECKGALNGCIGQSGDECS